MSDQTPPRPSQSSRRFKQTAQTTLSAARRIPLQRWLALAMITLEAFTIGYLSRTTIYPAMVIAVATYGTVSRLRFDMDRQRTYDIIALMAVIFVIKYMVTPDNPRYATLFASQQMAFALAQYVLAMQCVQFFLKRRDDQLPFSFPGIGVIALVCATMVSLKTGERSVVLKLCIGFTILSVLYCDTSRQFIKVLPARHRGRPIATVLVLAIVGGLGWFMASSMYKYERHVEHFVNRFLQQQRQTSSVGFSESSTLGSITLKKDRNSQQTALRVVSAVEPGYFRAKAYDIYENRKWLFNTEGRATYPEKSIPAVINLESHIGQAFKITGHSGAATQLFEVWPDADLGDTFASPLRTSWLYANAKIVTVDTHDVLRSSDAVSGVPYTLIVRDAPQKSALSTVDINAGESPPISATSLDLKLLATPPSWAQQSDPLLKLKDSLFENCTSFNEKLSATRRYFKQNYTYSLKVSLPNPQLEPIEWFLLEQPPAHCEYFASGAAVLLRMAGVPCRYVVGFVVSEKNQYSGEWVARNEDAHAWVEAYDESRGWVTVDTTPAAGIPDEATQSSATQLYEYLRDEFHRLRIGWQQRGVASIRSSLTSLIMSPLGLLTISFSGLIGSGMLLWKWRRASQADRTTYSEVSLVVAQLQTARQKLDVTLKRVWRARLPGETVDRYAQQLASGATDQHDPLSEASDWYAQYTRLRFAAEPDQTSVNLIATRANQLAAVLRKRVRHPDEHQDNA
jgi:protein-glutamine gamma-glutamyltransferase